MPGGAGTSPAWRGRDVLKASAVSLRSTPRAAVGKPRRLCCGVGRLYGTAGGEDSSLSPGRRSSPASTSGTGTNG